MYNYSDYEQYTVTDAEKRNLKLFIKHGSVNAAAKASGISRNTLKSSWRRIRDRAALKTFAPECGIVNKVPDVMNLKGMSDMRTNSEGKPVWYKYDVDLQKKAEVMRQVVEAFKEDLPVCENVKMRKNIVHNGDLLNCYVLADYHLGMVAHEMTTGDEDWNTEKAEQVLYNWFEMAVQSTPQAEKCLFLELGDFTHIDNQKGLTERSGNILEYDVPLNVLIRVAIRVMRRVIKLLAEKYKEVNVMVVDGNHNEGGANWMQELLTAYYEENERIIIDQNKTPYYCFEFGDVSLFAHHGHKKKPSECEEVFINRYREVFGRTKRSYAHLGHRHHHNLIEKSNMEIEQHPTLAAKDTHAADGGYSSDRKSHAITYHKNFGEVSRVTISRDMVR